MATRVLVILLALGLSGTGTAIAGDRSHGAEFRQVDRIVSFNRFDGWRVVDRDTLIVWTTASRPYLIELARPSNALRFERSIGITATGGTVHARFDHVVVDGLRYRIKAIYRMDRETARHYRNPRVVKSAHYPPRRGR